MRPWPRRGRSEPSRGHDEPCRRHREHGAAAVEFALVVPIFLALLFGIISYGMMLSVRQGISQATAEGARVYAVSPGGAPGATIQTNALTAVNDTISSYGVSCTSGGALVKGGASVGTCTIPSTTTTCSGGEGQCATVKIVYNYRANPMVPSFPGLGVTLPDTIQFQSTVRTNS